jgi:hypothetical protein
MATTVANSSLISFTARPRVQQRDLKKHKDT